MDIPNESSYNVSMSAELRMLETAIADFDREADDDFVDTRRLSAAIDRLPGQALPRRGGGQDAWRSSSCRAECLHLGGGAMPDVQDHGGGSTLRRRAAAQPARDR